MVTRQKSKTGKSSRKLTNAEVFVRLKPLLKIDYNPDKSQQVEGTFMGGSFHRKMGKYTDKSVIMKDLRLNKETQFNFPSVVRERLMFLSSSKWPFSISTLLLIFSEPARSHILSFALVKLLSSLTFPASIDNWNMVWDRLLLLFICVVRIFRFFSPTLIITIQSSSFWTLNSVKFSTKIPSILFSRIRRAFGFSLFYP